MFYDRMFFSVAEPEPPIKLERMEETTNKISLALEIQEEGSRRQPGRGSLPVRSSQSQTDRLPLSRPLI